MCVCVTFGCLIHVVKGSFRQCNALSPGKSDYHPKLLGSRDQNINSIYTFRTRVGDLYLCKPHLTQWLLTKEAEGFFNQCVCYLIALLTDSLHCGCGPGRSGLAAAGGSPHCSPMASVEGGAVLNTRM